MTYLEKIRKFYRERKRMPSMGELARLCEFASKNAAHKLARKLVAAGALAQDSAGKLLPWRGFGELPLLGLVEAGFPSPAEEELVDTLSLDDYLIRRPESTYLLTVKGDSMVGAGIMPGDRVLAERGREAKEGDVVIAEVDGEWTMKYFRKRDGRTVLEAANAKYPPITPKNQLNIAAVVRAVIRKY